jgi:FkbM family methyltransferase
MVAGLFINMIIKEKLYYQKLLSKKYLSIKKIFSNDKVVIFGAGRLGMSFANNLKKINVKVVSFIDNNKNLKGKIIDGIPVVSINSAIKKYQKYPIIIASVLYGNEIYELLKKNKFMYIYPTYYLNIQSKTFDAPGFNGVFKSFFIKKNQIDINKVFEMLEDEESKKVLANLINFRLTVESQYISNSYSKYKLFKEPLVCPLSKDEVFVDCGAYDGDTIKMFGEATNWQFDQIYAFEPDEINFKKMKKWVNENNINKKISIFKIGIYNKTGKLSFSNNGTFDSKITNKVDKSKEKEMANNYIKVTSLDDFFKNKKPPTLIKMDIEGSEIQALEGIKQIIKRNKPKLAISIYHQPSDLWRIILLIKSYNKNYKFFIRHFTKEFADTMCFAI